MGQGGNTASSKWLKEQDPAFDGFYWQLDYGVFSVGMIQKETLLHYTDTQEEHHRTRTSQDECRDLLQKCGLEYDERYVWNRDLRYGHAILRTSGPQRSLRIPAWILIPVRRGFRSRCRGRAMAHSAGGLSFSIRRCHFASSLVTMSRGLVV